MAESHLWWQRGVIYQVYPRSFADSDGDGIGDLEGVRSRLDYLAWLGIDAIWLSPIFRSPMVDFGYDVADYTDVDPIFGSLDDLDRLIGVAHERGMRVILDYVPNHTSDQHTWFLESRRSRDGPKRDWYVWRDPSAEGGPPNNWLSAFGGSAWQWDAATGQYYLHLFATAQPDLNWRNPEVRRAMLDVLRFWLDRGVDGFRVDVLWLVIKDEQLRDNPLNPDYDPATDHPSRRLIEAYSSDQPEVHEVVAEMRAVLDGYDERVLIGEIYLPVERLVAYYGADRPGAHMPFNFHLLSTPWRAREVEALIARYEGALPVAGWPNWVLGNHDNPRVASRLGEAQARVAAMLLLTLRGTPTIYYGEELGMRDVPVPSELVHDPEANIGIPNRPQGRDPYRSPMQWAPGPGAGFTRGDPWLPVSPDADSVNVEVERDAPGSMLSLYRSLLDLRRRQAALSVGGYAPVAADGDVLAYLREAAGERFLVALNFGERPGEVWLAAELGGGRAELSTLADRAGEAIGQVVRLRPNEGLIIRATERPPAR